MVALFAWSAWQKKEHTLRLAEGQARSFFDEIVYIRAWNARHGGVYAFVTPTCCSNPYLTGPDTLIRTQDGRMLTQINPAFMTRQLSTIAAQRGGIQFRIAGLTPLRPGNLADPWEAAAIRTFQAGTASKHFELVKTKKPPVFRYIAPLIAETRCLQCHQDDAIHQGTILGGISVSFTAAPLLQTVTAAVSTVHMVFTLIWITGLGGILTATCIIRKKQTEVEDANQAKTLFMANMCHDMRTPLVGIMGVTQRLGGQNASLHDQKLTKLISSSAASLLSIVNDITDFSRLDQKALDLHPRPFSLRSLLAETLEILRFASEDKGISFKITIAPNVPDRVVGDAFRISQILTNVVGNAVKFTDSGEICVGISMVQDTNRLHTSTCCLETTVEDSGPGIAPGQEKAIFADFYQGDSSLAKKHQGSGLGLAICRTLVTMMGGTISGSNRPAGGACFRFSIMLDTPGENTSEEQTSPHVHDTQGARKKYVPRSILVAEDNPLNQIYLKEILEDAGHRVMVAKNGIQVLQTLQTVHMDVILMDVQMPEMDGLETTRHIRSGTTASISPTIPIVGLTALTLEQDRDVCLAAGMNHCLTKPVSESTLLGIVDRSCPDTILPKAHEQHNETPLALQNLQEALDRLGGRTALYERMTKTFLSSSQKNMEDLQKACECENTRLVLRLAHSLKNSAGSLGLTALAHQAQMLEHQARQDNSNAFASHYDHIATCFHATKLLLTQNTSHE